MNQSIADGRVARISFPSRLSSDSCKTRYTIFHRAPLKYSRRQKKKKQRKNITRLRHRRVYNSHLFYLIFVLLLFFFNIGFTASLSGTSERKRGPVNFSRFAMSSTTPSLRVNSPRTLAFSASGRTAHEFFFTTAVFLFSYPPRSARMPSCGLHCNFAGRITPESFHEIPRK